MKRNDRYMNSKLLIIDDHREFKNTLSQYLKKRLTTIEIFKAATGEEGVAVAIKHKPGIILMDLQLPHMNGIAASEEIKKALPHCVIVVLSLFAGDMRKENHVSAAIDEVVGKNEIEKKLVPLLRKYLRR